MAKDNRTTSKARRANVATHTLAQLAEKVEGARSAAQDEQFNITHAAELLEALGEHIGQPHVRRSTLEWQDLGLRVEYVARVIRGHASGLAAPLETIERAAMSLHREGGAQ
jgi:hypothetical protein